jgi:hypothetical protein
MCDAVSLSLRELPTRYQTHPAIQSRRVGRGGEEEVQFFYERQPYPALLPIIVDEQFRIVRWGNRHRRSNILPHTGRVELRDITQGCWQHIDTQEVTIVGNAALHRGVWFPLLEGIKGIYVVDEKQVPTVFMLMTPSTDYYRIMTKSGLMPALLGEVV